MLVNVWDVASARAAAQPGCQALATASAGIAASVGSPDGKQIPLALVLDMIARIVAATDLPAGADLDAGYGDVTATIARGNRCRGGRREPRTPYGSPAGGGTGRAKRAASASGRGDVPLVLNARTDGFLARTAASDPAKVLADTIARRQSFLDVSVTCVFVPGHFDASTISQRVDAFGHGKLGGIGTPGGPSPHELAAVGVARVSHGLYPKRLALKALAGCATSAGRSRSWRNVVRSTCPAKCRSTASTNTGRAAEKTSCPSALRAA